MEFILIIIISFCIWIICCVFYIITLIIHKIFYKKYIVKKQDKLVNKIFIDIIKKIEIEKIQNESTIIMNRLIGKQHIVKYYISKKSIDKNNPCDRILNVVRAKLYLEGYQNFLSDNFNDYEINVII